jgi:hypothetical protein
MFAYDGSLGSAATGHSGASAHCRDSHTTQQETSRALACTPLRGLLAAEGPRKDPLCGRSVTFTHIPTSAAWSNAQLQAAASKLLTVKAAQRTRWFPVSGAELRQLGRKDTGWVSAIS